MTDLTPDELAARIEKLPAWARKHIAAREEYIATLETLTRTLHAQLTEARKDTTRAIGAAQPSGDLDLAREISGARDRLAAQLTEAREQIAAWEVAYEALRENPPEGGSAVPGQPARELPPGVKLPQDDDGYRVVEVLDGAANMDPLLVLPDRAEIRFADFYQVRYGDTEITAGARVLVIETDSPMIIRPASQTTTLIARG